jgi:hypothetical protein
MRAGKLKPFDVVLEESPGFVSGNYMKIYHPHGISAGAEFKLQATGNKKGYLGLVKYYKSYFGKEIDLAYHYDRHGQKNQHQLLVVSIHGKPLFTIYRVWLEWINESIIFDNKGVYIGIHSIRKNPIIVMNELKKASKYTHINWEDLFKEV